MKHEASRRLYVNIPLLENAVFLASLQTHHHHHPSYTDQQEVVEQGRRRRHQHQQQHQHGHGHGHGSSSNNNDGIMVAIRDNEMIDYLLSRLQMCEGPENNNSNNNSGHIVFPTSYNTRCTGNPGPWSILFVPKVTDQVVETIGLLSWQCARPYGLRVVRVKRDRPVNSNGEEEEVNLLDWEESEEDLLALIPCHQMDERAFYPFLTTETTIPTGHTHPIQPTHSWDLSTINQDNNHTKGDNMTIDNNNTNNLLKHTSPSMFFKLSSDSFEYIPGASMKPCCYSTKLKNKTMRFASSKHSHPSQPSTIEKKEESGGFKRAINFARQFLLDGTNGFTFRRQQDNNNNSINNSTANDAVSSKVFDATNHLPSLANNSQDNENTIKEKTLTGGMFGSSSIPSHSIPLPQLLLSNLSLTIPMLSSPRATVTQEKSDSKSDNSNRLPIVENGQPSSSETTRGGSSLLATGISFIERLLSPRPSARKTTKPFHEQSFVKEADQPLTPTVVVVPTEDTAIGMNDDDQCDLEQGSSHLVPSPPKNNPIPSHHSHGRNIRRVSLVSSSVEH
eukprot:scaffold3237_cov179-Ochromonas_danica.AAC.7